MVVRGRVAVLEDVDGRASARGLFDEGERGARQDATSIHVRRSTPRATSIQPSEDNRRVCKPKKEGEETHAGLARGRREEDAPRGLSFGQSRLEEVCGLRPVRLSGWGEAGVGVERTARGVRPDRVDGAILARVSTEWIGVRRRSSSVGLLREGARARTVSLVEFT